MAKKSIEQAVQTEVTALSDDLSLRLKDAMGSARDWKDEAETYIKRNPALCLGGAFLAGFILSKVARHA